MQDVLFKLEQLKRPRLLLRSAKLGAIEYTRNQHLRRYFADKKMPSHCEALTRLLELEVKVDAQRKNDSAAYSLIDHIDLLIAVLGEARLLRATQSQCL
ncbi:MAG: hypothetical protein GJ677_13370 [Rhodobacteraceae bacterium]|nr:hypothetical protein [Paracoccaceae bacterium]